MLETVIKRISIAATAFAAAASLAGCAGPKPFSIEERIWFDRAVGYDIQPYSEPFSGLPYQPYYRSPPYAPPPYVPPHHAPPPDEPPPDDPPYR